MKTRPGHREDDGARCCWECLPYLLGVTGGLTVGLVEDFTVGLGEGLGDGVGVA